MLQLDGNLSEWADGNWNAIATVVEGRNKYEGTADARAASKPYGRLTALVPAVQVNDDEFRPAPPCTEMWQGDVLELQLDAELVADFTDPNAGSDDYQIGIGISGDGRSLQSYRWLPRTIEGVIPLAGAGVVSASGYTIEALLPWSALGESPPYRVATLTGFNLSISDNDGDKARQESVVSASPARTTYDNPTEWGTLVLLP